jgi:hypothetical protein
MTRMWIVFAGETHYQSGASDARKAFTTEAEAREYATDLTHKEEWVEILEVAEGLELRVHEVHCEHTRLEPDQRHGGIYNRCLDCRAMILRKPSR